MDNGCREVYEKKLYLKFENTKRIAVEALRN